MGAINDDLSIITYQAHKGALGVNELPTPTQAQLKSGNYKKGSFIYHGMVIAIENPMYTYRKGQDANGKQWANLMQAHYGYIKSTTGNDGDELDVFFGTYPESQDVFVINQVDDKGAFDEHKIMLGFTSLMSAKIAYQLSYDRGWRGLSSIVPTTINQFLWWLENGNHKQPLKPNNLPLEGLERLSMNKLNWDSEANPIGTTLASVLYALRSGNDGALLSDPVTMNDINNHIQKDMGLGFVAMDALLSKVKDLERRMNKLMVILKGYAVNGDTEPLAVTISDPFKRSGTTNVVVLFELADGQTVTVWFHNPDTTPNKLAPTDTLISWRWQLNKKDVTIWVAPESGKDLNPRDVGRRVMRLADKNSAAFKKANAKRSDKLAAIKALEETAKTKELDVQKINNDVSAIDALLNDAKIKLATLKTENDKAESELATGGGADTGGDYKLPEIDRTQKPFFNENGEIYSMYVADFGRSVLLGNNSNSKLVYALDDGMQVIAQELVVGGSDAGVKKASKKLLDKYNNVTTLRMNYSDVIEYLAARSIAVASDVGLKTPRWLVFGNPYDVTLDGRKYVNVRFAGLEFFSHIKTETISGVRAKFASAESSTIFYVDFELLEDMYASKDIVEYVPDDSLDVTNPTDYAKITSSYDLALRYQDSLDAMMQTRLAEFRATIEATDWYLQKGTRRIEFLNVALGAVISLTMSQVRDNGNVYGYRIMARADGKEVDLGADDLTKTPKQLANFAMDEAKKLAASQVAAEKKKMDAAVQGKEGYFDVSGLMDSLSPKEAMEKLIEQGAGAWTVSKAVDTGRYVAWIVSANDTITYSLPSYSLNSVIEYAQKDRATALEEKAKQGNGDTPAPVSSNYTIGKSKYNTVKVTVNDVGGAKSYLLDVVNKGTGTNFTFDNVDKALEWLANSLFVGGGTVDQVKRTLVLRDGEDVLGIKNKAPAPDKTETLESAKASATGVKKSGDLAIGDAVVLKINTQPNPLKVRIDEVDNASDMAKITILAKFKDGQWVDEPAPNTKSMSLLTIEASTGMKFPKATENTGRQADIDYLNSVINAQVDLYDNAVGEKVDAMYDTYPNDAEIEALLDKAIDVITDAAKARASKAQSQLAA